MKLEADGGSLLVGLPEVRHGVIGGENVTYLGGPGLTVDVRAETVILLLREVVRVQHACVRELLDLRARTWMRVPQCPDAPERA